MTKLEGLIDSRPDFAALGNEWFVGRYEIYRGSIEPLDPVKPGKEDANPWNSSALHSDGIRPYFPLQDPNLFSSFIRLGARGEPSENKILSWVNEYGLLELTEEGKKGIQDGVLNQAPMSVEEFRSEVMQARSAMLLYQDLRRADGRNLQRRLIEMRENPSSKKVGPLSEMDKLLVSLYAGPKKFSWPLLQRARTLLESFVEQRIARIQMSFWNMAPETTKEVGEWTDSTNEYVPTQSWRFPDLLSAIYVQFYLIMVNAVPLRVCEHPNCRTPFPATRKDKRFCTDACRSGARRYT